MEKIYFNIQTCPQTKTVADKRLIFFRKNETTIFFSNGSKKTQS